jgi:hypothetical protein
MKLATGKEVKVGQLVKGQDVNGNFVTGMVAEIDEKENRIGITLPEVRSWLIPHKTELLKEKTE